MAFSKPRRIRRGLTPQQQVLEDLFSKLNDYECKDLHNLLFGECESGPESRNAAWRSAKYRVKQRLHEINDNQFLDYDSCYKLRQAFKDGQLSRFGLLEVVKRVFPDRASRASNNAPPRSGGSTSHQLQQQQQQQHASTSHYSAPNPSSSQVPMDLDVADDEAAFPPQQDEEPPESAGGTYTFVVS
jgi:hypothetical protein